jgi:hypothetical protein
MAETPRGPRKMTQELNLTTMEPPKVGSLTTTPKFGERSSDLTKAIPK